jgi:alpha-galactosidase
MARGARSSPLLLLALLAVAAAATAAEAARFPGGNWTEELRGAARRGRHGHGYVWRHRRRAFENGLGRTPQMG